MDFSAVRTTQLNQAKEGKNYLYLPIGGKYSKAGLEKVLLVVFYI